MKNTRKAAPSTRGDARRRLNESLTSMREAWKEVDTLSHGSVVRNAAGRWMWTRKVAGKTVTVALSQEQSAAFMAAIRSNRKIEKLLAEIRRQSQLHLLRSLPGPRRKSPTNPTKTLLS